MTTLQKYGQIGTDAVRQLRENKLRAGLPFMINVDELSADQCYLEMPNGDIQLVELNARNNDFSIVRTLSLEEANVIREQLHLQVV
jgi:hypothetical protein